MTCPHCTAKLRVQVDTDGHGGLVEDVTPCQCEGARWRRGECADCGRGGLRNGRRLGKKRCPPCKLEHDRARRRRNERAWFATRNGRAKKLAANRRRYHEDYHFRQRKLEAGREYHALLRQHQDRAA